MWYGCGLLRRCAPSWSIRETILDDEKNDNARETAEYRMLLEVRKPGVTREAMKRNVDYNSLSGGWF